MSELPESIDWRDLGAVTSVKDQGQCGSCWAFSAIGAIEGAYYLSTGNLVEFSEQMLVDCDDNDMGCGGGLMDYAFDWEKKEGGLCTLADYPYQGVAGECAEASCDLVPGSELFEFDDVPPQSTAALMEALTHQPVSVAIFAASPLFQFYQGGIFDWCPDALSSILDHGVLAVGYGREPPIDWDPFAYTDGYFIIKNSWGETWGDNGYIKLARDTTDENDGEGNGMCGILLQASYPVIAKSSVPEESSAESVLMTKTETTETVTYTTTTTTVTTTLEVSGDEEQELAEATTTETSTVTMVAAAAAAGEGGGGAEVKLAGAPAETEEDLLFELILQGQILAIE